MENIVNCDCEVIHQEKVDSVIKVMPNSENINKLSNLYKIYSNPTRIKILFALSCEELCVCDLGALLNMTKSAISHQLSFLKSLNLISNRKEGKIVFYSLADNCARDILKQGLHHISE